MPSIKPNVKVKEHYCSRARGLWRWCTWQILRAQVEILKANAQVPQAQNTWCMRQLVCIKKCMEKSPKCMEKNCVTISFEIKFSYLKCVADLSLVPILKPFWRRLVKFFETVTPLSKRMERQTTLYVAGAEVSPQIAFSSTGEVPNRNKNNSFKKSNKFRSKYVCFGCRKAREERTICLKIHLFGFPKTLVMRHATTAARNVVLFSTLIGALELERALKFNGRSRSGQW